MNMKKLAMVFPYAPKYREAIYQLMDRELNIDWFFCGNAQRNLKLFDYSLLRHCDLSMREERIIGPVTAYKGMGKLHLERYDAIIVPGAVRSFPVWEIIMKYRSPHTKVYAWTHGWYGRESRWQRILKRFFFRHFDGILLYGNYARKLMIQEGFAPEKLILIYNSLDYDRQVSLRETLTQGNIYRSHFGNDNRTLIFLGRLTEEKRLDMMIDAAAMLQRKGELYNLVFVGDGTERGRLEALARQRGLEGRTWFYGACYDERTNAELLYNADLCVSPGNIGLTAVHTLTFGCPAVTHGDFKWQAPEFESIIPDRTGDFFERGSVGSLAGSISGWFAKHKDDREAIRRSCYREIEAHWNPHYQMEVIRKLLQD